MEDLLSFTYWDILFILVCLASSIQWVMSLLNIFLTKKINPAKTYKSTNPPLISVLIPARNEDTKIGALLMSLKVQTYPNYEIIVCNDDSTDNTLNVAKSYMDKVPNFQVFEGAPKPDGWAGKVWACHQISEIAKGEIFLFLDADLELHPETLQLAMAEKTYEKVNYLGLNAYYVWPRSYLMNLVCTFWYWDIPNTTPLFQNKLSSGCFEMLDADLYKKFGGHKAIKSEYVDGFALPAMARKAGGTFVWRYSYLLVRCLVYTSVGKALNGYGRWIYPLLGKYIFLFVMIFKYVPFILQFAFAPFYVQYFILLIPTLIIRIIIAIIGSENIIMAILYLPQQLILYTFAWIYWWFNGLRTKLIWKQRFV